MKKVISLFLIAITALTLPSCETFYTTQADGTAIIKTNQFQLPSKIGPYQRDQILAFDGSGYQVGAGYNHYSADHQSALTVYVRSSRSGQKISADDSQKYFLISQEALLLAHERVNKIRTTKINGHGTLGHLSEYRYDDVFAGKPTRVASFLAVFRDDTRLIKYRISSPASQRDQTYQSLLQAIQALGKLN